MHMHVAGYRPRRTSRSAAAHTTRSPLERTSVAGAFARNEAFPTRASAANSTSEPVLGAAEPSGPAPARQRGESTAEGVTIEAQLNTVAGVPALDRYPLASWLITLSLLFVACGSTESTYGSGISDAGPSDASSDPLMDVALDASDDVPDVVDSATEPVASCEECMVTAYTCKGVVQPQSATMLVSNPTSDSCTFDLPGTTYSFNCATGELCRVDGDAMICAASTFDGQTLSFDHFGTPVTCHAN
jgi:hypothetical protein